MKLFPLILLLLLVCVGCSTISQSRRAEWLEDNQRQQDMQDDYDRARAFWLIR